MSMLRPATLLRFSLKLDALVSLASGLLLCGLSTDLARYFSLSPILLFSAGAICFPYAVLLWSLAQRKALARTGVLAIIVGNALWADVALALALGIGADPSPAGQAYLASHVLATGTFALMQALGLRASERVVPAAVSA